MCCIYLTSNLIFCLYQISQRNSVALSIYHGFYLFQDLWSARVKGISEDKGGLYMVKDEHISNVLKQVSTAAVQRPKMDGNLWHKKLGHTSISTMKNIEFFQETKLPLAKQSRLVFPRSILRSTNPLLNLHMDVWGPYTFPHT